MAQPDHHIDLHEDKIGEVMLLRISGRLDPTSISTLEKKVQELLQNGNIKLVIDLGGVTYLSSAGMRVLLATTKKIDAMAGSFAVCNTPTNILDILKMAGFDRVLKLFATEEEALRHL